MKLEFYPIEKLKNELLKIIGKYLNLESYKIFFFGSRVSGKGNENSDIDIGIQGPREIPLSLMAKIREEIDNLSILYKIEIVDFQKVSADFQQVALQQIESISL